MCTHRCSVPHNELLHQHHPAGGHWLLPRHLLTPAARHEASMGHRWVRFSRCFQDASFCCPGDAEWNLRPLITILTPVLSTETSRHVSTKVRGSSGTPSSYTEVSQCFLFCRFFELKAYFKPLHNTPTRNVLWWCLIYFSFGINIVRKKTCGRFYYAIPLTIKPVKISNDKNFCVFISHSKIDK